MHTNRIESYLTIIIATSIKKHNLDTDAISFLYKKDWEYTKRYEKQLLNELELHIELYRQHKELLENIAHIIENYMRNELKKTEKIFLETFKSNINKYFFGDLEAHKVEEMLYNLWAIWFAEFFADIFIDEQNKKKVLSYTTHEILNHTMSRLRGFNLFFDDNFKLNTKDEKIARRIVLKLLGLLVGAGFITKRLTYEHERDVRSIYVYTFDVLASLKCNLYHLKINLVIPEIFISNTMPYVKTLTYLSISKVMLTSEGNMRDFKLKDLNLLYKLFSTKYIFDAEYYNEIYPHVLENTPTQLINEPSEWRLNMKETNAGPYWYNLIFLNLKNYKQWLVEGVYWNYIFDFRGRLYIDSVASYQSAKIFRHLYGYAINIEKTSSESVVVDLDKYINIICKETTLILDYPNIDTAKQRKEIFWLFIEIAKIFKNSLLNHEKYSLSTEELIRLAIKYYAYDIVLLDLEKKLEFIFIKTILRELNLGSNFNFIIFKDSTASALQLLTLVLNVKNKQLTEIFNLNSKTTWYDPYTYIIMLFLQETNISPKFLKYFNRNFLKKTIMTYNYSATLYTCMQNFYDEVEIRKMTSEERKLITDYFVSFYRFLEKVFNNKNFFETSLTDLNAKLLKVLIDENALVIYLNDESHTALHYYTKEGKRMNFLNKEGVRSTTILWQLTNFLDIKKTKNALKPNTIHALDAALIRLTIISNPYVIATIHDSFGAPLHAVEDIIKLVNKNLNLIYYKTRDIEWYSNKQYYSIYVIF